MRFVSFLFVFSLVFTVFAQRENSFGFEYRQKMGFLAAHRGVMGHLPREHAFAGELSFYIKTNGRKFWHSTCSFPYLGATLFAGSVGNKEILGRFYGAYGFVEFPFVKREKYRFLAKLGSGLAYTTRVFNYEDNPKNVAMSTHMNALICIGFTNHFYFGQNRISLGIDMTHFSNGAYKVPNLGVNLPYLTLGYGRTLKSFKKDTLLRNPSIPYKKWLYGLTGVITAKEVFPTGGTKYPVYGLSGYARRFFKPKVGMEVMLDVISKQAIFAYKPEIPKTQWDILQIGLYTGYLFPLDQFHFVLGMGVYLKDKYQPEDFLYHRVGMRYYFTNGMHAQVVLKSHWARADYVEWGLGYTFNYKNR
jgi:hypothetical protein